MFWGVSPTAGSKGDSRLSCGKYLLRGNWLVIVEGGIVGLILIQICVIV